MGPQINFRIVDILDAKYTPERLLNLTPDFHSGGSDGSISISNILERLLRSFPEERESLRPYVDRANSYSNECGCSMGGAFLAGSLALVILNGFFFNALGKANLTTDVVLGTAFVFGAGIVGKLTGIGIARIRLAMLYRHLRIRYRVEGE